MHKDLKKTPSKIAQELKKNEQAVHNVIEKYAETGTVHDRSTNASESFPPLHTFGVK